MEPLTRIRTHWRVSGETRNVTWKYVRRALILGAVSLSITLAAIVAWVAQGRHEAYANKVAYCRVREESSTKLSTFAHSVAVFADGTVKIVEASANPNRPGLVRFAALATELRQAANAYKPVEFDDCMSAKAQP